MQQLRSILATLLTGAFSVAQAAPVVFPPGASTPGATSAFGAVFTDVDRRGTRIAYYDAYGRRIASYPVPVSPGDETLSFLGVRFLHDRVATVRITSGTTPLGRQENRHRDVVAMDDFIFGEPTR